MHFKPDAIAASLGCLKRRFAERIKELMIVVEIPFLTVRSGIWIIRCSWLLL
jgi:hypothetical protein